MKAKMLLRKLGLIGLLLTGALPAYAGFMVTNSPSSMLAQNDGFTVANQTNWTKPNSQNFNQTPIQPQTLAQNQERTQIQDQAHNQDPAQDEDQDQAQNQAPDQSQSKTQDQAQQGYTADLRKGSLRDNLLRIADADHWGQLVWSLSYDYYWPKQTTVTAPTLQALLNKILATYPLQASIYPQEKIIVVNPRI